MYWRKFNISFSFQCDVLRKKKSIAMIITGWFHAALSLSVPEPLVNSVSQLYELQELKTVNSYLSQASICCQLLPWNLPHPLLSVNKGHSRLFLDLLHLGPTVHHRNPPIPPNPLTQHSTLGRAMSKTNPVYCTILLSTFAVIMNVFATCSAAPKVPNYSYCCFKLKLN